MIRMSKVVCGFVCLKQGADLEVNDSRGWTALLHCTSTGHQQMVKFLLDNHANVNVRRVYGVVKFLPPQFLYFLNLTVGLMRRVHGPQRARLGLHSTDGGSCLGTRNHRSVPSGSRKLTRHVLC